MNIALIVDPYGEEKPGGLGRAIFEMTKGIVRSEGDNEYTIYTKNPPKTDLSLPGNNWKLEALGVSYLWLSGGKKLRRSHDLCIFFTPIIPLLFFPKKSIVVVHDFAYLELPGESLKQKLTSFALYTLHRVSLWKASVIVAVSQTAKESTLKYFGIRPEKIRVIYNGSISLGESPEKMEIPEKFFLFAGVIKARKNVHGVIRAFAEFSETHQDYSLIIAGKIGGEYAEEMQKLAETLGIAPRVRFLGYVTDGELAYLYSRAVALAFPSLVEGFGMPVLEAMERGLPVITSNAGALAEVAGGAAVLVDPYNPSDIARAMNLLVENPAVRQEYIEKGRRRE
jgi:glycosyltransferase involved in cell wall biosynthesis